MTDDPVPTPEKRREWDEWVAQLPSKLQGILRSNNLDWFARYALTRNPGRASYFRLYSIQACQCDQGYHLTLLAFNSATDEPYCMVGNLSVESLLPYPYSTAHLPDSETLEAERRMMERVKEQQILPMAGMLPDGEDEMTELDLGQMMEEVMKRIRQQPGMEDAQIQEIYTTAPLGGPDDGELMVKIDPLMLPKTGKGGQKHDH